MMEILYFSDKPWKKKKKWTNIEIKTKMKYLKNKQKTGKEHIRIKN